MKELRDNAEYCVDLFFPQAENQQATEVSISILSQTLCDAPSRIFSECLASKAGFTICKRLSVASRRVASRRTNSNCKWSTRRDARQTRRTRRDASE